MRKNIETFINECVVDCDEPFELSIYVESDTWRAAIVAAQARKAPLFDRQGKNAMIAHGATLADALDRLDVICATPYLIIPEPKKVTKVNTVQIARGILMAALLEMEDSKQYIIDDVCCDYAPYDGARIFHHSEPKMIIHVYFCDDEPDGAMWMVDTLDTGTGEVNPQPLTAETLTEALGKLA